MSDIDTAAADGLKVLDPKRPIREADIYSYLSWVALGFVPCGGSASPDWRIPDAYINTALSPGMD